MNEYKVAVIGAGNWGKNILKTVNNLYTVKTVGYNGSEETKRFLKQYYPDAHIDTDVKAIASDPLIDAVFIATPIGTHAELTKLFLEHGKHVFVEKPLSTKTSEIESLYTLAEKENKILQTGYVYFYDKAFQLLQKEVLEENDLELSLRWEKWGTFGTPIQTNLLVHELALACKLLGDVIEVTNLKTAEDAITLKTIHARGNASYYIDRQKKERQKSISLCTSTGTSYVITSGVLTREIAGKNICIADFSSQEILVNECKAFQAALQSLHADNTHSKLIDLQVAQILQKISSIDGSL
ncbi:MAG: putative dehydrogenase [Acidimicrobiales bacterium]|jgi:predicted dehydrogenase